MADDDVIKNVVIRALFDADQVLTQQKKLREQVNQIKEEMQSLASQGKASYSDIARSMIDVNKINMTNNIKDLKARIQELRTEYATNAKFNHEAARKNLADIETEKQKIAELRQAYSEKTSSIRQAQRELSQGQKEVTSSADAFLGKIVGFAGAAIGITSVLSAITKITAALKEATQAAYEFTKATFSFVVGIRAIERAGVDITIQQAYEQLENLRSSFGIFSKRELVIGAAAFYNLNRDMGFTRDQLFQLQEAIATLAVVNGKSMEEVQRTVALALSSGYTEGLQRLGVSINRVTIAEKAMELGFEGGYTALNEQERALATYLLILEKVGVYTDDLLAYQETLPGKIDTATASIRDSTVALGENTLALQLWWAELKKSAVELAAYVAGSMNVGARLEFINGVIQQQEERLGRTLSHVERVKLRRRLEDAWETSLFRGETIPEIFKRYEIPSETWNPVQLGDTEALQSEAEEALADIYAILEDHLADLKEAQSDFEEDSKEALEDYLQDMEELRIDHQRREADIKRDHDRRLVELQIDHDRRMEELELEHQRKMDDIELEYQRKFDDLESGLESDLAKIWADYYNKLESEAASYRNKQIDAEIKYQETLRRLHEGFLFDLEDALRERDARQVLQLIRRYNLEKDQADRSFQQDMDRLKRQHEERLAELARQRDERLRQLYEELEARRAALEIAYQRELDDERRKFEQKQTDEEARYEQSRSDEARRFLQRLADEERRYWIARGDRLLKYQREIEDLNAHLQERYEIIAQALADEVTLTDTMMEDVRKVLDDTLGPGGEADEIYRKFSEMVIERMTAAGMSAVNTMSAAAAAIALINQLPILNQVAPTSSINPARTVPPPVSYAEGGITIADKPTSAIYGEAGPELAAFIPLNNTSAANSALSSLGGAVGGSAQSKTIVEISLDRYLEGKIINTTMDSVADVILRRFRQ